MKLSTVTLFAQDVDALASFYADALGLAGTVSDLPSFRQLSGGGAEIGFAFPGVYDLLDLQGEENPTGLRGCMTFALDADEAISDAIDRVVAHGGSIAKPPFRTHYGATLAVLRDPEGNAFRFIMNDAA